MRNLTTTGDSNLSAYNRCPTALEGGRAIKQDGTGYASNEIASGLAKGISANEFEANTVPSVVAFGIIALVDIGANVIKGDLLMAGNNTMEGKLVPLTIGKYTLAIAREDGLANKTIKADIISPNKDTSGGGVSTFIDLTDTINDYTGKALEVLRVNAGVSGIESKDLSLLDIDDTTATNISYDNTTSNLTATQTQSAIDEVIEFTTVTKVFYVDGNRIDIYVENGSIIRPYKTIQNAITAASSGTTILIAPGSYTENVTLKSGVNLQSIFTNSLFAVSIHGKVSCSLTSGSVLLNSIGFYNTTSNVLEFSGANKQKIRAYNCKFECNSNGLHHTIAVTNTHANSEMFFRNCLIQTLDSSGGGQCINTINTVACSIGLDTTTVKITDNTDNIAIALDGSVSFWQRMDEIRGRITVSSTASCNISIVGIYSSTQPCLTTNSAGYTTLSGVMVSSTANPIITGAGTFIYSGVTYISTGKGLAGTLNGGAGAGVGALQSESSLNNIYDNTTSGLTAINVQLAIDELTSIKLSKNGINGSFTTTDGKTITVVDGQITAIV